MGKRRQRVWPPCQCGEASSFAEHMPACGKPTCLRRWWTLVGVPSLLVLAALVTAGLLIGPDHDRTCPDGMTDKGGGICVQADSP